MNDLRDLWNQQANRPAGPVVIAEAERAMIPLALWEVRAQVHGCKILWLVDNSPSLHALVKGRLENQAMDRAIALTYIMCFILDCSIYFEHVDSFSNFSDGISSELEKDKWAAEHGISTKAMMPHSRWWTPNLAKRWTVLGLEKGGPFVHAQQ